MIWSQWISFDKTWLSDQEILTTAPCEDDDRRRRLVTAQQNLTGDGEPVRVGVGLVTANAFEVLGARAAARPVIPPRKTAQRSARCRTGLSACGRRDMAAIRIVGRRIMLNDVPVEIVGVMPRGFPAADRLQRRCRRADTIWRPLQIDCGTRSWQPRLLRGRHSRARPVSGDRHRGAAALTAALTEQGLYPEAMQFTAFAVASTTRFAAGSARRCGC